MTEPKTDTTAVLPAQPKLVLLHGYISTDMIEPHHRNRLTSTHPTGWWIEGVEPDENEDRPMYSLDTGDPHPLAEPPLSGVAAQERYAYAFAAAGRRLSRWTVEVAVTGWNPIPADDANAAGADCGFEPVLAIAKHTVIVQDSGGEQHVFTHLTDTQASKVRVDVLNHTPIEIDLPPNGMTPPTGDRLASETILLPNPVRVWIRTSLQPTDVHTLAALGENERQRKMAATR